MDHPAGAGPDRRHLEAVAVEQRPDPLGRDRLRSGGEEFDRVKSSSAAFRIPASTSSQKTKGPPRACSTRLIVTAERIMERFS